MNLLLPSPTSRRAALAATRLLILCGILCGAPSLASAHAATHHKERSAYEVSWRGARVASLQLLTGCPTHTHLPAALSAQSTGLARDLHAFVIRLDSFLSPTLFTPLQGRTHITEEGKKRSYISMFSPTPAVTVNATIFGTAKDPVTHALPAQGHDLLSWLLHLRWQTPLKHGLNQRYHVWDGWKLVELRASVQRAESIATPHKTYTAWSIAVTRAPLSLLPQPATPRAVPQPLGTLWIEQAAPHRLVAMDFESRVGLANIRINTSSLTPCDTPKQSGAE